MKLEYSRFTKVHCSHGRHVSNINVVAQSILFKMRPTKKNNVCHKV